MSRHKRRKKNSHCFDNSTQKNALAGLVTFLICIVVIYGIFKNSSDSFFREKVREPSVQQAEESSDSSEAKTAKETASTEKKVKYKNAGEVPAAPGAPEIEEDYLKPNKYSRSQKVLKKVKGIVVHYVDNPGSSAKQNRDYFNNLGRTHVRKASSHYIIGLKGEIIQCIPRGEIAYASKIRNKDTISIECCHKKANGKFNKKTMKSLVNLAEWLCRTYDITEEQVIRHYDVTGKMCPKYYVKHPKAWKKLKSRIKKKIKENRALYEKKSVSAQD